MILEHPYVSLFFYVCDGTRAASRCLHVMIRYDLLTIDWGLRKSVHEPTLCSNCSTLIITDTGV